jgi:hypothetical protein
MHSPDIRTALRLNHGNASPHLPSEMSEEQQLFTAAGRFRPLVLFLLASMLSLCTSTAPSSLTRWLAGLSSMFPLPPFLLPSILPAQGLFALLSSHTLGYLLSRPDQVIPAHFSGFGCVCIVLYISRLCRQQPWSHVTIFPTDCQHRYPIYRCHWLQVLVTRYIILLSIEATAIMYQDRLCHQDGNCFSFEVIEHCHWRLESFLTLFANGATARMSTDSARIFSHQRARRASYR